MGNTFQWEIVKGIFHGRGRGNFSGENCNFLGGGGMYHEGSSPQGRGGELQGRIIHSEHCSKFLNLKIQSKNTIFTSGEIPQWGRNFRGGEFFIGESFPRMRSFLYGGNFYDKIFWGERIFCGELSLNPFFGMAGTQDRYVREEYESDL